MAPELHHTHNIDELVWKWGYPRTQLWARLGPHRINYRFSHSKKGHLYALIAWGQGVILEVGMDQGRYRGLDVGSSIGRSRRETTTKARLAQ